MATRKIHYFEENNVTWRLYFNEILETNTISAIFWSFHSVKDLILFIKDKINRNYRMKILYIEAMYENSKKINENIMKFEDRRKNFFFIKSKQRQIWIQERSIYFIPS